MCYRTKCIINVCTKYFAENYLRLKIILHTLLRENVCINLSIYEKEQADNSTTNRVNN